MHAESVEIFIMSFFNDMNQLIADNKNEKKKLTKVFDTSTLQLDTIMSYFKIINFF